MLKCQQILWKIILQNELQPDLDTSIHFYTCIGSGGLYDDNIYY